MDDPTLGGRLRRIEEQLQTLSQAAGVPYQRPGARLPPSVSELLLAGKAVHAIGELRLITGMSLIEAEAAIDAAQPT